MPSTPLRGGCLCGAVRYTTRADPFDVGWCCCRTCQRSVGAASIPWASYTADQLELAGPARWYPSSRHAERGFCGRCGTSLFWRSSDGRHVDLALASLDDPAALAPQNVIFTADNQPWAPLADHLPRWPADAPKDRPAADVVATLDWLADLLTLHAIPWRVTGGLAARSHGATRPLADIDLDLPDEALAALQPALAPFVVDPPHRHRSDSWDLLLCTLDHHGQAVDLAGGSSCRIFDRAHATWKDDPFHPHEVVHREIFGRVVPVVARADLLAYKRALDRDVDRIDVAQIEAATPD